MPSKVEDKALWAVLLPPVVIAFGVIVFATCGLAAWQRAAPLSAPTLFPFSETWYDKSVAAATPAEGAADAQMAVKLAPARAENWMLLAYQYSRVDHGVSARVISAVRQSYAVGPLTFEVSAYRLNFILNAWSGLPQDVHELARQEAHEFGTSDIGLLYLLRTAPTITDPQAHLEFSMIAMVARFQYNQKSQKP
jgi:hypothetical protein